MTCPTCKGTGELRHEAWLPPKEIALRLSVNVDTIYLWIKTNRFSAGAIRKVGGRYEIREDAFPITR